MNKGIFGRDPASPEVRDHRFATNVRHSSRSPPANQVAKQQRQNHDPELQHTLLKEPGTANHEEDEKTLRLVGVASPLISSCK